TPTSAASSCQKTGSDTRCARTTTPAGSRCSSRTTHPLRAGRKTVAKTDEHTSIPRDLVDDDTVFTYQGKQEMTSADVTDANTRLRESGAVMRMTEDESQ